MTYQQRRLRRENYNEGNCFIQFSEKTYKDKDIKLAYYGTIQDLYDCEYQHENGYDYE